MADPDYQWVDPDQTAAFVFRGPAVELVEIDELQAIINQLNIDLLNCQAQIPTDQDITDAIQAAINAGLPNEEVAQQSLDLVREKQQLEGNCSGIQRQLNIATQLMSDILANAT